MPCYVQHRSLTSAITALRLQRGVKHLHRLGARATMEFLIELADQIGDLPATLEVLAQHEERLTPEMLHLTDGDRFPPHPLQAVPQ